MGWLDKIGQLLGAKPPVQDEGAAHALAPETPAEPTMDDWQALCMAVGQALALDDSDELWGEVRQAIEQPAQYLDRFADDLVNRGMDEPEQVSPWLALVDGLQRRKQNFELDWKLNMNDAIWALQQLQTVEQRGLDLQALAGSKALNHEALQEAGDYLRSQGLGLVSFDIDSDSYPLSVLGSSAVAPLQALAERVCGKLLALHN
ncbi:DUF6630 family protein [Comamonas koreensis]|uniref:DUF6630 domain-containing protein n=1 Tax=Comamonas koreensis TaxID=160825 RepID=A0AAW4XZT4_9BURK|nr:hypothetical protein [Comamonas koreensis]MCD2166543.1 hypothetical protein [Comamonas koreensis]